MCRVGIGSAGKGGTERRKEKLLFLTAFVQSSLYIQLYSIQRCFYGSALYCNLQGFEGNF